MNRYSLAYLQSLPTLVQGTCDDLKIVTDEMDGTGRVVKRKTWLSRMTAEDGMPYDNMVTVEAWNGSRWFTLHTYQAV